MTQFDNIEVWQKRAYARAKTCIVIFNEYEKG